MLPIEKAREFRNVCMQTAIANYKRDGNLSPVVIMIKGDDSLLFFPVKGTVRNLADKLRSVAAEIKAHTCIIAMQQEGRLLLSFEHAASSTMEIWAAHNTAGNVDEFSKIHDGYLYEGVFLGVLERVSGDIN